MKAHLPSRRPPALFVVFLVGLSALAAGTLSDPPEDTLGPDPFRHVPAGLPGEPPSPADNPRDDARFALGRALFFDPLLSVDHSTSCASCHLPDHGFTHPEAFPQGAHGRRPSRSVPTLFNRGYGKSQMWDGRFATLEEQVLAPISNPDEMDLPLEDAAARLAEHADYGPRFEALFGRPANPDDLGRALASFVRRIFHGGTVVDQFRVGAFNALEPDERGGLWIFESKGGCWRCHAGDLFTDEELHNTGVGAKDGAPEEGRFAVTGVEADRGKFKTPTLRGLVHTAPYMHDGSLATLEEVVQFYREGGVANSHLDKDMQVLELTDREAEMLVAFLRALSRKAEE